MQHCEEVIPEFGIRLKKSLKTKRISQKKLADILDVDKDTVNKWCNDHFYPNAGYLRKICLVLNVSPGYLLELED